MRRCHASRLASPAPVVQVSATRSWLNKNIQKSKNMRLLLKFKSCYWTLAWTTPLLRFCSCLSGSFLDKVPNDPLEIKHHSLVGQGHDLWERLLAFVGFNSGSAPWDIELVLQDFQRQGCNRAKKVSFSKPKCNKKQSFSLCLTVHGGRNRSVCAAFPRSVVGNATCLQSISK